ncbi:polysaccharide biosynthesis protein [Roseovarius salis]|uniref:polysaccharide biosynthesis protein n=1 Tax=Roseovarius salis TaxID=3376063 RepID=UPI0037C5BCDF
MLYNIAISLSRQQKRLIILAIDILLIQVAYLLAKTLLQWPESLYIDPAAAAVELALMATAGTVAIILLGLHKVKLNAYQMQGVIESAFVAAVIAIIGMIASAFTGAHEMPVRLFIVAAMIFLILSVAGRLLMRHILLAIYRRGAPLKRILIYGAGQTGQQLAAALATDDAVEPVAFVDDDRRLQGLTIAGLRVLPPKDLERVIAQRNIERIVLAMPSASTNVRTQLSRNLSGLGCEVHILPSFADLVTNTARTLTDTRPVDMNDLLGRNGLDKELPGVSDNYAQRNIMVTGAGGSIGSEICRQLIACRPKALILVDHCELALFEIDRELRKTGAKIKIIPVLGSVCDAGLVDEVMAVHDVEVVLHAAAYKHVPLVEMNAIEGIRTNVLGTKVVADAARAAGVERFILVSTDKAVRPSSIMGGSKRFAEMIVQDLATRSETTRFSMVRFGNVLGSSGSVIPLFQEQIAQGGPVTLTHTDVTRYFMTIPEAVRLVLLAGSFARGGDVFVLDMGQPVPVRKLARKLIQNAGYRVRDAENPDGDIEIRITGLRPGEKLHEELLIGTDMLTTPHPKILRAQESHLSELEMAKALRSLREAVEGRCHDTLRETLARWIETDEAKEPITINE